MTMCPGTGLLSQMIELGAGAGSCRKSERARGLATLPSSRPPRRRCRVGGLQVIEQVPGAGQQLAGDRDGGDLLPAPFRDAGVGRGRTPGTAWRSAPPGSSPAAARLSPAYLCPGLCVNQWQALAGGRWAGHRRPGAGSVAYVCPGPGCCLVLDGTARVRGRPEAGRAATRSALEPGRAHPASSGGGDRGRAVITWRLLRSGLIRLVPRVERPGLSWCAAVVPSAT